MGWIETSDSSAICSTALASEVRVVREQVETHLEVRGGELVFGNTNLEGKRVPVYGGARTVRVGCHCLTREAWKLLKRQIDGWE